MPKKKRLDDDDDDDDTGLSAAEKKCKNLQPKKPVRAEISETPPKTDETQLLQKHGSAQADEIYSKAEETLNNFVRLHPMLSFEALSQSTMSVVAEIIADGSKEVNEPEICSKLHDDQFLGPPCKRIGERPCSQGDKCISMFLARMRYGKNSPYEFVCKEFLTPSQFLQFKKGKGLPTCPGKCLLCSRYYVTYHYQLARNSNEYLFQEPLASTNFTNSFNTPDGYRPSAALNVDEGFCNSRAGRETELKHLFFRPIVRFLSTDYKFCLDSKRDPYILQRNGTGSSQQNFGTASGSRLGLGQ